MLVFDNPLNDSLREIEGYCCIYRLVKKKKKKKMAPPKWWEKMASPYSKKFKKFKFCDFSFSASVQPISTCPQSNLLILWLIKLIRDWLILGFKYSLAYWRYLVSNIHWLIDSQFFRCLGVLQDPCSPSPNILFLLISDDFAVHGHLWSKTNDIHCNMLLVIYFFIWREHLVLSLSISKMDHSLHSHKLICMSNCP